MKESTESSGKYNTWGEVGLEIMASIEAKEELSPKQLSMFALAFCSAQALLTIKDTLSKPQENAIGISMQIELARMGCPEPE